MRKEIYKNMLTLTDDWLSLLKENFIKDMISETEFIIMYSEALNNRREAIGIFIKYSYKIDLYLSDN